MRRLLGSELSRRTWWITFVVLLITALVFSVLVGKYVSRLYDPVEMGQSSTGEWADLSEFGFRARLDTMDLSTSLPSSGDPLNDTSAPTGTKFLRVLMTIEPLVEADEDLGCRFVLLNGTGEELGYQADGLEGPPSKECMFLDFENDRVRGVPFQSQTVYIVVPESLDSYTVELNPYFSDSRVYWSFTA